MTRENSEPQPPRCQLCGSAIGRYLCKRPGDTLQFRSLAGSGRSKRRISEDAIGRIVAARALQVEWVAIARELHASVATLQRACRRAAAAIELPRWIERED